MGKQFKKIIKLEYKKKNLPDIVHILNIHIYNGKKIK